jgi:Subtilase family
MTGVKAYYGGKDGSADIRVLNNSYGCYACLDQSVLDQINAANAADMLFVASAGNDGSNNDTTPEYPASYNAPNVVAVAAFDSQDHLATDGLAGSLISSNYGASSVHLGGPGVLIYSPVPGPTYRYWDGTSLAAPYVSGTAALSLSVCEGDTEFLKPNLLNNVVVTPALTGKTTTGGRLNAYNSLSAASSACPGTGYGLVTGNELSRPAFINGHWVTVYDSGTISLTVNGHTKTLTYGQYTTASVLAQALRDNINNDGTYPVRARLSWTTLLPSYGNVSLAAKTTGGSTCYTVSANSTWNTQYFPQPSFRISPSGAALVGCR